MKKLKEDRVINISGYNIKSNINVVLIS